MAGQGRLGDKAKVPLDVHGCPACPHPAIGPAIQGSPDVHVNRRPALRVDDPGIHAACCGANTWTATQGSSTVFINGKGAHRMGDQNRHCGGPGELVEGSPNVLVGESSAGRYTAAVGPAASTSAGNDNRVSGAGDGRAGRDVGLGPDSSASARRGVAGPAPGAVPRSYPALFTDEYQLECALVGVRGEPRRGQRYEITLPDGSNKVGASGFDGVIRLSGLTAPGTARLVLPDVDAHGPDRWFSEGMMYAQGGVQIPVGESRVVLPPAVYRGRLTGLLFDTSKCFLLPGAMPGLWELTQLYREHPGLAVMVSGHADREGPASYNLTLSQERAEAIEAFLQDQVDRWTPWYGVDKPVAKRWGVREDQHMLSALGLYRGPVHGRGDPATKDAVACFRTASGLGEGGLDEAMRAKLIERYMQIDGTTLPAGTKVHHHGCGEHHPDIDTAAGVAEPENRRVEVFFFEGAIDPAPPASCPSGGCTQYPAWRKRAIEVVDVNVAPEVVFLLVDELGLPLKHGKVKIRYPDGRTREATTDDQGTFRARVQASDRLELELDDVHEARPGDGIQTASGTHVRAGEAV